MLWPAKPWGQWLGQAPLQSIHLVSGLGTTASLVKVVEMCRDGKQLCLVLRQAELSCTRVWTLPLCWGLLRSCALAPSPFPLHTLPELLPPAHLIFLPISGHSGAPSAAVGQEKGKTHNVQHPSPWLAGWIVPAASHAAFLSVGLTLSSLEQHLHLL